MPTLDLTEYTPGAFEALDGVDLSTISEEELVFVRTELGASYRIKIDPMVNPDDAEKIHIFIATLPQVIDHPQYAGRIIEVGKEWHHGAADNAPKIISIYRVRSSAA